ncbi:MAG: 50S ribosomal protein L21 [Flavobacteriaceae bacterium]|nr:50S ribosomal protein L21 [Flavobacteriaceae bacterium]MDG2290528.1 50S ribosomal protein L21 [Flavobacteriaceae bacterium]
MFAIVEIAGQQFKVAKDQKVFVHRLDAKTGDKVSFDQVFMMADGDKITVGAPAVANASVEAKVVRHLKDDKVIVFKKKRRKGYRVKNGHRQSLTEIVIESVGVGKAKKAAPKAKAEAPKAEAPKAAVPKAAKKAAPKAAADFSSKTVAELKELAKAAGIAGISSMKKADLIAALEAKK